MYIIRGLIYNLPSPTATSYSTVSNVTTTVYRCIIDVLYTVCEPCNRLSSDSAESITKNGLPKYGGISSSRYNLSHGGTFDTAPLYARPVEYIVNGRVWSQAASAGALLVCRCP